MTIDIREIMGILPHAYPFLLVDRVEELEPGTRIRAVKNVTVNEHHFQGHFPDFPIMPGVLIVEALAQAGGILWVKSMKEEMDRPLMLFVGIDKARFRKPVVPGDRLILDVEILKVRGEIVKMRGRASVDGETAAEAEFLATVRNRG